MVMLAVRGRTEDIPRLTEAGYLWDLKVDGCRCLANVSDGRVTLTSRANVRMTSQYPEIVSVLSAALPHGRWTIDGEVAVNDERGLPSWPLTHKRNAQVRDPSGWAARLPATFYAFDILEADGVSTQLLPYSERRERLQALSGLKVTPMTPNGEALWKLVTEHHLEGILGKRPGSSYRSGRSSDWVKIKRTSTVTCLVGGYDPGSGSRASSFGALHLYLLDDAHSLVRVGNVGSGFSDKEVLEVKEALNHPPLIIEVEFLDASPAGQLRQPVFKRVRTDVDVTACTLDQLT